MKKLIALILAAILLSASCIALADEEKPNGFEVTFDFAQDMQYNCIDKVNAFLSVFPLSNLEIKEQNRVFAIVTGKTSDSRSVEYPITGFSKLTLYGVQDESADLYYYQLDLSVHYSTEGETYESYLAQWDIDHPGLQRVLFYIGHIGLNDHDAIYATIIYRKPSL